MKKINKKAFTIVELVIVIAVMAVLAAVLIPTFSGIIKNSKLRADESELSAINTQLAIFKTENGREIESESDIYNVIQETYGEDKAKDFSPRLAKDGYHFWYDTEANKIIMSSIEDLEDANVVAISQTSEPTESEFTDKNKNSFRMFKGRYFFLDNGGSDVANALNKLDNVGKDGDSIGSVLTALSEISGEDKAFADSAANILQNTAVVAYGLGTHVANANNEIKDVYFSKTIEELYATDVIINNDSALYLTLPKNVEKINSYALEFKTQSYLYIDASEEELKEILSADGVVNCEIVLSNGAKYFVDGSELKKSDNTVVSTLDYSSASVVDDIILNEIETDKLQLVRQEDGSYKLYVAVDYTGEIELNVIEFKGTNGEEIVARGETWSAKDNITYENGKFTVNGYENTTEAKAGEITVSIQNYTKTIKVYGVKVNNVVVRGYENLGLNIRYEDYVSIEQFTTVITLPYAPNSSVNTWEFTPSMVTNYPGTSVIPTGAIAVSDLDGMTYSYENGKGALSINSGYADNTIFTASVSFKYSDERFDSVESKITYKFHLINSEDKSFELADVVSSVKDKLGSDYVLGNTNAIALKYLFKPIEGKNLDNQKIAVEVSAGGSSYIIRKDDVTKENLAEYQLDLSVIDRDGLNDGDDGNKRIKISICIGAVQSVDGVDAIVNVGAQTTLTAIFVDANNITAENVASMPSSNSTNIVLLSDIELTTAKVLKNVHGNLHKINARNGETKTTGYWDAFITLNGTMDNTLVLGPVYPSVGFLESNAKYAWDGVKLTGASSSVKNSYLFGFRAPVQIISATNAQIIDSVIEGGTYANVHVATSKVTLTNVALIQDKNGYTSTYDSSIKVYGMGIFCDTAAGCEIIMDGSTKQYNWISVQDAEKINTTNSTSGLTLSVSSIIEEMINEGDKYVHYVTDADGNDVTDADGNVVKYVNTGIIQETEMKHNKKWLITYEVTDEPVREISLVCQNGQTYEKSKRYDYKLITCAKVGDLWSCKHYYARSISNAENNKISVADFLPSGWTSQSNENYKNYLSSRV